MMTRIVIPDPPAPNPKVKEANKPKRYVWVGGDEPAWDFISGGSKDSKCIPFEDTNKKK